MALEADVYTAAPVGSYIENLDDTLRNTLALLEKSLNIEETVEYGTPRSSDLPDRRLSQPSPHLEPLPSSNTKEKTKRFMLEHDKTTRTQNDQYTSYTPATTTSSMAMLSAFIPLSAVAEPLSALLKVPAPVEGDPVHGTMIIIRLSEALQHRLYKLVRFPLVIIENLLMIGRIEEVAKLLHDLPAVRDDNLLCKYAKRAVTLTRTIATTRNITTAIITALLILTKFLQGIHLRNLHHKIGNYDQRVWVADTADDFYLLNDYLGTWDGTLTGDTKVDSALRDSHFYATSPDVSLCFKLLDLCMDKRLAGHVCLDICDSLVYCMNNTLDKVELGQIRQVTQKLLSYARHCFEDDEYESRLCDTFTSGITLLITLRARGIEGMSSLLDISDPYKSNQLCTILVNNGMAKEALEFAPKCSVHVAEVWAAWGFKCLREYDYTEAREKFAQYFAISDPDERQLTVLSDIKNALAKTKFFAEVVHYLRTYGTPRLLVEWWVEHGNIAEACKFLMEHSLPSDFLINQIVEPCCRMGKLPALLEALRDADVYYITATCKHFNTKGEFYVLLEFQLMMHDRLRAGLTCIKIFLELGAFDFQAQEKYLLEAKGHFLASLSDKSHHELLSTEEIEKYASRVQVQLQIVECFKTRVDRLPPSMAHFSVFGNQKQRTALAYLVISLNLELGYKLITHFGLPCVPIMRSAAQLLGASGDGPAVEALLKQLQTLNVPDVESDDVVLSAIKAFASSGHVKPAEMLIARLKQDRARVLAFLACGRTATAALLAERTSQPKEIMDLLKVAPP